MIESGQNNICCMLGVLHTSIVHCAELADFLRSLLPIICILCRPENLQFSIAKIHLFTRNVHHQTICMLLCGSACWLGLVYYANNAGSRRHVVRSSVYVYTYCINIKCVLLSACSQLSWIMSTYVGTPTIYVNVCVCSYVCYTEWCCSI